MDTHYENMEEMCDVCGNVGYNEVVFTCSSCKIAREHIYCMSVDKINLEKFPESWVCDSCKATNIRNLVDQTSNSIDDDEQLQQASTQSQVPSYNPKYSPPTLAINKTTKVEFGSTLVEHQNLVVHEQEDSNMATRRTSLFEREQRRAARACRRTTSSSQGGGNQLPNINPFVYQGPYSSDFRRTFTQFSVSFERMGDELNRLYLNYVPREELSRANQQLEETKVELELCRARSRVQIEKLKAELAKAKSQLDDVKYLGEKFRKTEEFVVLQNKIMECGVNWSIGEASIEHPKIDFSFLSVRFKAAICDTYDNEYSKKVGKGRVREEFQDCLDM